MSDEYDDIKKRVALTGFVAEPVPEFQELGVVALSEAASQQLVELSAARAIIREERAEIARLRGLIEGLECSRPVKQDAFYERDGKQYFRVENVPCGKCGACRAKQATADDA